MINNGNNIFYYEKNILTLIITYLSLLRNNIETLNCWLVELFTDLVIIS